MIPAVTTRHALGESVTDPHIDAIASSFVKARLAATPLKNYPGPMPESLPAAYLCQARAISLWPDQVAGWKVGSIRTDLAERYGQNRLIGPIFRSAIRRLKPGESVEFRTFAGGFAAAEPEYVLRLGRDAEPAQQNWSRAEAQDLVDTVFAGVEIAGSPFAGINDFGPAVVVSDFGNNDGLLLGQEVADWRTRPFPEWSSSLYIDDVLTGAGSVDDLVGGAFESLRFALEQTARMGRSLRKGDLISTGAITGVHRIFAGQLARAEFGTGDRIECTAV